MKSIFALILLSFLFIHQSFSQEKALTALQILNKSIDAIGGEKLLRTVKTRYTDDETTMKGSKVHWIVKVMLPNKGLFQIVYNDTILYQSGFDGKTGFETRGDTKVPAEPTKFLDKIYMRNIFELLDFIDPSLWKMKLMGTEKVEDKICYKIKGTLINGTIEYIFIDKSTFLTIKTENISKKERGRYPIVYCYNYKRFGGILYPYDFKAIDGKLVQLVHLVKMSVNENITEEDFK